MAGQIVRSVRFTDEEWEKIEEASLDLGVSKSEFIRAMVLHGKITKKVKTRLGVN